MFQPRGKIEAWLHWIIRCYSKPAKSIVVTIDFPEGIPLRLDCPHVKPDGEVRIGRWGREDVQGCGQGRGTVMLIVGTEAEWSLKQHRRASWPTLPLWNAKPPIF